MRKILSNTWTVLNKSEKKRFLVLIVLDILMSVADIAFLAALLWIIQSYIHPGSNKNIPFLPSWSASRNPVSFIAVFFFLFGLKNLTAFFISRSEYRFIGEVAIRISRKTLALYQQGEFEQFVNTDSSVHIRKIAFQPFEFCQYILTGIQQIITQSFLIILSIIAILLFNAKLFLFLLLALLPPVIIIFHYIKKRLTVAKQDIRANNERSFQYLLDALKGFVEGRIYDRNNFFMKRFIDSRSQFSTALFESMSIQTLPSRAIEIFAVMGLFILIIITNRFGYTDSSVFITIGAFIAAAYKIIPGVVKIINATGQIKAYEFSAGEMADEGLQKEEEQQRSSNGIQSVQFKNIHFSYPAQQVLKNFNLSMKEGDFIGLTGESGKGKTTVINLLLGFLQPGSGEILINSSVQDKKDIMSYWPTISYTRQQPFFIYDTIAKNITLEEETADPEKLRYSVDISGLNDLIAASPEGINKVITENGKNISGGQQQRICIARALYKRSDMILLDEPFNELDEASSIKILEHLQQLASGGKIILLITHDKKSLAFCNKILSLDEN